MISTKRVRKHRARIKLRKFARLDQVKESEISSDESAKESDGDTCTSDQSESDILVHHKILSLQERDDQNNSAIGSSNHSCSSNAVHNQQFDAVPELQIANVDNCHLTSDSEEPAEISQLRLWAVESQVPMSHLDNLLGILRVRVLPQLPACSKTFLKTTSADYVIEVMTDGDNLPGEFVYFGIEPGLQACVNPQLHENLVLDLDFNIDGVKIKKSSLKQLWPCLCRVYYQKLPQVYKPFPVFAFYGNKKPKDMNQFFHKFIHEMNHLSRTGVVIQGRLFRIRIRRIINDTPARDLVKCTSGHTSLNGCSRCDTVAVKIDHNIVYADVGNPRTDWDFRNFTDLNHHLDDISPLIALDPPIDMIIAFILDIMHLLYLGVQLRLFQNWKDGEAAVRLSVAQRNELDRRTKMLKRDIPYEFKRKMRSSNHYPDFKATEHRFFTLYCGPIVLKKILSEACYNHFLLFHVACRLISSRDAIRHSRLAKQYFSDFVETSKTLYGLKFVSVNVHSLHHVVDDVINSGCNANDLSAFPFESDLCKAKYLLRSPKNTLAQWCRRIHEQRAVLDHTAQVPPETEILKTNKDGQILKVMHKQQYFSTNHPDNTVLMQDGSVVKIVKIFLRNGTLHANVLDHRIKKPLYEQPCNSSFFHIHEIDSQHCSHQTRCVNFGMISTKVVRISINFVTDGPKRTFVLPLLHSS
ncbi:hypothetical protein QAD02_018850 [Eretmocerus hayati]|uniref:Uncharacterized protein n=1 Tax=Eretmocerus hayati TaxID=131215 RepID=A0ACC2PJ10_9HYME|nr:hypothetical protein QAD02_018850 [Eretmocerus hayati]